MECGNCGDHLYVSLDGPEFTASSWPGEGVERRSAVRSADAESLPAAARRVYELVQEHADTELATQLLHLFGCTEPGCTDRIE